MEPTIKRIISTSSMESCEDAKGEYCYCQCMGIFHGINHNPIRERQEKQKAKGKPLDDCNCEVSEVEDTVHSSMFLHQKTDRFFKVCENCGGRIFIHDVEGVIAFMVGKGIRIKKS